MVVCNICSLLKDEKLIINFDDGVFIYVTHPDIANPVIISKVHDFKPTEIDINYAIEQAREIWGKVKVHSVQMVMKHWNLPLEIAR
jgi:hypothetical protein